MPNSLRRAFERYVTQTHACDNQGGALMNESDGYVKGLRHVTVGVDGAQDDMLFVRDILGLRVIKATVLFDGVRPVYHLYGSRDGNAGTVFTTFPWRLIGLTETESELGTSLQMPPWMKDRRDEFLRQLEPITLDRPVRALAGNGRIA
jgi:catechol 2,3-dioxygenase-like lactoylglutathione lyase family enzyme